MRMMKVMMMKMVMGDGDVAVALAVAGDDEDDDEDGDGQQSCPGVVGMAKQDGNRAYGWWKMCTSALCRDLRTPMFSQKNWSTWSLLQLRSSCTTCRPTWSSCHLGRLAPRAAPLALARRLVYRLDQDDQDKIAPPPRPPLRPSFPPAQWSKIATLLAILQK